jgi:hypothetical protein
MTAPIPYPKPSKTEIATMSPKTQLSGIKGLFKKVAFHAYKLKSQEGQLGLDAVGVLEKELERLYGIEEAFDILRTEQLKGHAHD